MARPIADHLQKALGQPVTIENRTGAGTTIGAAAVAKSDPDGYTLLISTNTSYTLAPILYTKAGYTAASLEPIIIVAESALVLNVSLASGVKTVAELVAAAKAKPEAFSYASVGVGTTPHLMGELFNQTAGLKLAHVPYRGSAPAMTDLIGGQVQVFFDVAASALPNIQGGKIRGLMVLQEKRNAHMPDIPASAEVGFGNMISGFWVAMAAPAGTPKPVIERLNREVDSFLKTPDFSKQLSNLTLAPVGGPPTRLTERMAKETPMWKAVADKAGIKID